MSFNRKEKNLVRQPTNSGFHAATGELDATTTTEIIRFGVSASKVSYQSTDSLAGNISFSINGTDFFDSTAFTAAAQASYSTHNVVAVKVTRTAGTGRMALAAK